MKKKFIIAILFFVTLTTTAFADNVDIWINPSLKISELDKIIIVPGNVIDLRAGNYLLPADVLQQNLEEQASKGIRTALKGKSITIKTFQQAFQDVNLMYGDQNQDIEV